MRASCHFANGFFGLLLHHATGAQACCAGMTTRGWLFGRHCSMEQCRTGLRGWVGSLGQAFPVVAGNADDDVSCSGSLHFHWTQGFKTLHPRSASGEMFGSSIRFFDPSRAASGEMFGSSFCNQSEDSLVGSQGRSYPGRNRL